MVSGKKFSCDPSILHNPPVGFAVREATYDDIPELTRVHYAAFNEGYDFWKDLAPEDAVTRQWLESHWAEGISSNKTKTFVVEDLLKGGRLAAFKRWVLPVQADNQSQNPPKAGYKYPTRLAEVLWGGGLKNQIEIMGYRPHLSE
ncbi:hypothetical protein TWF696_007844 [Orbilia brochopaga]|uniref:N-acetyltransferase domain-containing protein n=1 Tax=Orbilia brochopaga TaxID=3140254 RepID=A0AAV9UMV3_9PEZI